MAIYSENALFFLKSSSLLLLTRSQCKVSDTQVTVKACGPLVKISQCISLFRNYLPLEKGGAFHLNKLESTSPIDALCQVWLKFGPAVLEKKSLRQQRRRRTNFDQKSSLEPSFGSCKLKICESSGISCGDLFRLIDIE